MACFVIVRMLIELMRELWSLSMLMFDRCSAKFYNIWNRMLQNIFED